MTLKESRRSLGRCFGMLALWLRIVTTYINSGNNIRQLIARPGGTHPSAASDYHRTRIYKSRLNPRARPRSIVSIKAVRERIPGKIDGGAQTSNNRGGRLQRGAAVISKAINVARLPGSAPLKVRRFAPKFAHPARGG